MKKKMNTARDIEEFSCAFVVSQELVKHYVDHLKHLEFSKDLRNKTMTEKRRNREAKKIRRLQLARVSTNWGG